MTLDWGHIPVSNLTDRLVSWREVWTSQRTQSWGGAMIRETPSLRPNSPLNETKHFVKNNC